MNAPKRSNGGWRRRVPRVFAGVLAFVAVLCALAAVSAVFRRGMQPVRQAVDLLFVPAPANLAYAAFLGILAAAVARRKRVAWWLLVVYLGLQLLFELLLLVAPHSIYVNAAGEALRVPQWLSAAFAFSAAFAAAALVVLALSRREFSAKVQRASIAKAMAVLFGLAAVFIVAGWGLVVLFPGTLGASHRFAYAAEKVLGGVLRFDLNRDGRAPGLVNLVLGLLGAIALLAAFVTLLRSQRAAAVLHPDEEARVRALLAEYGERDSLGYFATRRDKAVVFSPTGKAAVTYRVVAGTCLASGDPIGDPEAWGPAIDAWLTLARDYAWSPAAMGTSEDGAHAYARAGLKVLELGDEAILWVREFTVDGRDMRPVRQAVHRIERAGYTARIRRHADLSAAEMAEAVRLADAWRDTAAERGFSMALSRLGDVDDGECVLVEARGPDGMQAGLLSLVPWGRTGLSLDLMRRDRTADNGLMEFMVTALVREAPKLGVERVSLNFAVFRSAFEEGARIGAGPVLRAWRGLLLFFSRWYQLESLYRSNVKYRPQWVPRFVCFAERRELARVGLACAIAEGFLVLPWRRGPATATPRPRHEQAVAELVPAAVAALGVPAVEPAVPEQVTVRLDKLARLRAAGVEAYPIGYPRTAGCGELTERFAALAPDTRTGERVAVAGRVMLLRDHGGLLFATLRDWTGDVQVMVTAAARPDDWRSTVDLGDHVGVTGEVVTTRRGQISVLADTWALTAKCLHPLPDKHRGLADPESRVRQRYLDLIVNPEARDMLRARSAVLHSLRGTLHDRDFVEVETPMLQPVHGGANARPFVTHINAYDMRLYLRIAPELYLKRLCVGGVERVFELGRTFRNEGVSFKHNPEFTMLEAYQAYADYRSMVDLARVLIQDAARAALGTTVIVHDGVEYDIGGDWPVVPLNDAVSKALGEQVAPDTPAVRLRELADRAAVPYDPNWGTGQLVLELYERLVEHDTKGPTFYTDFPTDVSPLTRAGDDPRLAERWDLVAFGTELGTGYSE
ncbi:MAG TPA: bifunctional lysylphosphatidylglycerol synthetase/lysine--tRNA ligase LysX, partial [Micromonosporaceae bacterium]|nr:bifunctional lysylphosphatidylglycerol synthetase/lysine--tRNA ligase LysX [Micromonosporaceae bacterium]